MSEPPVPRDSEHRVEQAALRRRAARDERSTSLQSTSLSGVLDAAKIMGIDVGLQTVAGTLRRVQILEVAAEWLAVQSFAGSAIVMQRSSIASLSTASTAPTSVIEREETSSDTGPVELIERWIGWGNAVSIRCGAAVLHATVLSGGVDVISVMTTAGETTYVSVDSLTEVVSSSSS